MSVWFMKHTTPEEHMHTRMIRKRMVPVIVLLCSFLMALGFVLALWNYGLFFPSWVQWHTFSQELDVNGDGHAEAVNLMNRHLVVVDSDDNEYVTPSEWMVADVTLGDLTGDDIPEILVLTWENAAADEEAVLELPLLGRPFGFNQHVHVLDYVEGDVRHLWDSAPLNMEACNVHVVDKGVMCINLPHDRATYWRWQNPGFVLHSKRDLDEFVVQLR